MFQHKKLKEWKSKKNKNTIKPQDTCQNKGMYSQMKTFKFIFKSKSRDERKN